MKCCKCKCMFKKIKEICEETCSEHCASYPPYIGDNGNWFIWNGTEYIDSGVAAQGEKGDKGDPGIDIVGIQALTTTTPGVSVSKIPFDDMLRDNTNGIVEIQPDGTIIFHENGLYKIDWQITYDDITIGDAEVKVMFFVNNGPWAFTSTFGNRGQICGSELFISSFVGIDPPIYGGLTFRNTGGITLANTEIQANIVIVKLK